MIGQSEQAVIGAVMLDPQAYWRVADLLTAEDFESGECRALFEVVAEARRAGREADPVTISDAHPLLARRALEIANGAFATANVRLYAEQVAAKATARKVRTAGQRIAKLADADAVGEAQRILAACQPRATSAARPLRAYLQDAVAMIQQRFDASETLTGVPTGLDWLDEQTAGWQRGDLIVLAARPSVGKTAFAVQCAVAAARAGHGVFVASMEQSGEQFAERVMAHLSGVSLTHLMQPKRIEDGEWPRIVSATNTGAELPMVIDETAALSVEAICARARQCNATRRLGLIVIDYLTQIMPPRAEKTVDAIQLITRQLKALAKELAVPVMVLSQLNRDGDGRPALKNLRDSGAIEQDADVVVFLHRPSAQHREREEIIIGKQRNGPVDEARLFVDLARMRFEAGDWQDEEADGRQSRGFVAYMDRRRKA